MLLRRTNCLPAGAGCLKAQQVEHCLLTWALCPPLVAGYLSSQFPSDNWSTASLSVSATKSLSVISSALWGVLGVAAVHCQENCAPCSPDPFPSLCPARWLNARFPAPRSSSRNPSPPFPLLFGQPKSVVTRDMGEDGPSGGILSVMLWILSTTLFWRADAKPGCAVGMEQRNEIVNNDESLTFLWRNWTSSWPHTLQLPQHSCLKQTRILQTPCSIHGSKSSR